MASAMVQKATGQTRARLPAAAAVRAARDHGPDLGREQAGDHARRLRPAGSGPRTSRASASSTCRRAMWQGQQLRARRVDRRGDRPPDLERQQPDERLGAGLRLPVLALPARRLPRRRRLRAVLHRDAGAGRGRGDHQRHAGPAGGAEPGLGAHPAGAAADRAAAGPGRPAPTLHRKLAGLSLPPQAGDASKALARAGLGQALRVPRERRQARVGGRRVRTGRRRDHGAAGRPRQPHALRPRRLAQGRQPAHERRRREGRRQRRLDRGRHVHREACGLRDAVRPDARPSSGRATSCCWTRSTNVAFGERKRPRLVGKLESK